MLVFPLVCESKFSLKHQQARSFPDKPLKFLNGRIEYYYVHIFSWFYSPFSQLNPVAVEAIHFIIGCGKKKKNYFRSIHQNEEYALWHTKWAIYWSPLCGCMAKSFEVLFLSFLLSLFYSRWIELSEILVLSQYAMVFGDRTTKQFVYREACANNFHI